MHPIRFRLGVSPDPLEERIVPLNPIARFKGPTFKKKDGRGREKGVERFGKGREGKKNGDRPPIIFGLKVALHVLLQYFAKIFPAWGLHL